MMVKTFDKISIWNDDFMFDTIVICDILFPSTFNIPPMPRTQVLFTFSNGLTNLPHLESYCSWSYCQCLLEMSQYQSDFSDILSYNLILYLN